MQLPIQTLFISHDHKYMTIYKEDSRDLLPIKYSCMGKQEAMQRSLQWIHITE
jgi:hypothetical protein